MKRLRAAWRMLREAVNRLVHAVKMVIRLMVMLVCLSLAIFIGSLGAAYVGRMFGWQTKIMVTTTQIYTPINIVDANTAVVIPEPPDPKHSIPLDLSKPGPPKSV